MKIRDVNTQSPEVSKQIYKMLNEWQFISPSMFGLRITIIISLVRDILIFWPILVLLIFFYTKKFQIVLF